jgi:cell division septal protein FtsQ
VTPRRLRILRIAAVAVVLGLGVYGLRFVPFFDVRRIEVVGLRYLDPMTVLDALDVAPDRSVFASLRDVEARAAALPGIARADVRRRLPGALQIRLAELMPVALVPGDSGLLPLAGSGDTLPFDPLVSGMSLPVVAEPDTSVLRILADVRVMDSTLFEFVDAAASLGGGVQLVAGDRHIVLQGTFGPDEFLALRAVRRDLVDRAETFEAIDTRFEGWVIVRREDA